MGLLDSLFSGSQGGGLLDFLRSNAMNQQFPGLQASDTAQYGQPMQANAQMPIAQQPPPVIQAQPMQAQPAPQVQPMQQPAQPQGPSFGDSLMQGFQGFAAPSAGGLLGHLAGGIAGLSGQPTPANLTKQWLIQRGADPVAAQAAIGNPKVLESLIEQLKPKALISTGAGHLYDPNLKQDIKTYEPEDKIPSGFQKDDAGNMHFIPNGPADPAYQRQLATQGIDPTMPKVLGRGGELYHYENGKVVIDHKNDATQAEATLDEPTVNSMASQYLAGDKSVMQNLGRGAQGAANIVKLRTEIYNQANAQGLNGKDIVNNFNEQAGNLAGQRSIGTRAANISLAANEANNMIPIALKASDAVPRGEWMPWNKMVQAYQTGTSSPELARFVAATNSLVNSYVRAVSPSGVPTDSMREHAYSMLNSAQSPKAYQAVTSIMQDEMKAAMEAPGQVRKELRHDEKPAETSSGTPKAGNYMWMPGKGLVPTQ